MFCFNSYRRRQPPCCWSGRRQAEAREARIAIEKARERAILDEAEALGAPAVGEDWTRTSVELREELSSLRSQSGA